MTGGLTRPEHSVALRDALRIRERILACPCTYCLRRDKAVLAWGRSVCTTTDRQWPACTTDGQAPTFTLDEQQLKDMP